MSVNRVSSPRLTEAARNVQKLLKMRLLIGIPDSAGLHPHSKVSNAVIGYINEFGYDEMHIPARPFLIPGVAAAKDVIAKQMALAGAAVLAGAPVDAAERPMMAAGLAAVDEVRKRITDGPFTPLAKRTLAARRARGRTGEKPLIDTGALRNSITYVVKKG